MSDAWTSSTPLSNQDFRKLLETPRAHDAPRHNSLVPGRATPKPVRVASGDDKPKKPFKKPPPKFAKGKEEEEEGEGSQYRDRAKERREGVAVADSEEVQGISIEHSKYLGGDVEHTHLVKGLDYALLHQERLKLQSQKQAPGEGGEGEGADGDAAAAGAPRLQKQDLKFAGLAGRAVFDALFTPRSRRADIAEMFAPRRTAFVFEQEGEDGVPVPDVPVTLRRSKADCPPPRDAVSATADAQLLERIAKIMSYIKLNATGKGGIKRDGKGGKEHTDFIKSLLAGSEGKGQDIQVHGELKMKHASALHGGGATVATGPAAAAAGGPGDDDDDEDIFGDAGSDYAPEMPPPKTDAAKAPEAQRKPESGYFDTRDDLSDLPAAGAHAGDDVDMELEEGQAPPPLPPPPLTGDEYLPGPPPGPTPGSAGRGGAGAGPSGRGGGADERWRAPSTAAAPKLPSNLQGDAYEELFPEAMLGAGVVVDSDDEEMMTTRDPSKAGATEEGGGEEGGEGGGGQGPKGKGGKPLTARQLKRAEENRRNQKLDNDLGKIEKLFEEKGYGNEGAFKAPERSAVEETPMRAKKRRI